MLTRVRCRPIVRYAHALQCPLQNKAEVLELRPYYEISFALRFTKGKKQQETKQTRATAINALKITEINKQK